MEIFNQSRNLILFSSHPSTFLMNTKTLPFKKYHTFLGTSTVKFIFRKMLEFLINNIYVVLGDLILQQSAYIPWARFVLLYHLTFLEFLWVLIIEKFLHQRKTDRLTVSSTLTGISTVLLKVSVLQILFW